MAKVQETIHINLEYFQKNYIILTVDIVKTLAFKVLGEEVAGKLVDANLEILTTEDVSISVKTFFLDNKVQSENVERLLKADNQNVHVVQVFSANMD